MLPCSVFDIKYSHFVVYRIAKTISCDISRRTLVYLRHDDKSSLIVAFYDEK